VWARWDGKVMSGERRRREPDVGWLAGKHMRGGERTLRVVGRGSVLDKGAEDALAALACLLDAVSKGDDVERDVVLLEFFGEADERALGVGRGVVERGADKDDDALAEVFVLSVLERELCDRDCRRDRPFAVASARLRAR